MPRYTITAEHTNGQSTNHCCTHGVVDDPADLLNIEMEADDDEAAHAAGVDALAKLVANPEECRCTRGRRPGSDAWWNSVTVNVAVAD